MTELLTALALAIALEGIVYALFPEAMRRFMRQVLELSDNTLRIAGLFAAVAGAGTIALIRFVF